MERKVLCAIREQSNIHFQVKSFALESNHCLQSREAKDFLSRSLIVCVCNVSENIRIVDAGNCHFITNPPPVNDVAIYLFICLFRYYWSHYPRALAHSDTSR